MEHPDPPREQLIHRDRLHPNPDNPRLEAGDVSERARSVRTSGQFLALLVRPAPEYGDGHYLIEDGYRRWVAMKSSFDTMRCHVRIPLAGENPALRSLVVGLAANTGKPLDPVERAQALGRLRDEFKMSQAEIATATGFHATAVSRSMMLLDLNSGTLERVRTGQLSTEAAEAIVKSHRAKQRKQKGHKPADVGWEPDHFTGNHPQARAAAIMCTAREHNSRRRIGRSANFAGACGQCWETVIRQDESLVQQVKFTDIVGPVPFMPPWPVGHPMNQQSRET